MMTIEDDAVVHELHLDTAPEAVFEMFTDAGQLQRWIGLSAQTDPRPGGLFRFEIAPGQFCEGAYVAVERPSRVVFTWGWTDPAMGVPPGSSRVEVHLERAGTGTRLRLVHDHLPTGMRLLHDDGWERFLARLRALDAGESPAPYPSETPEQRRAVIDDRRPRTKDIDS